MTDHTRETAPRPARLTALVERGAFAALAGFVIVACIPHGLVGPDGRFGLQLFSFLLATIVTLVADARLSRTAAWLTGMLMLLAAVGALQIVPLPYGVVERLSPNSARVYSESSAVLEASGTSPSKPRLSIAPRRSAEIALLILACAALVYSSARLTNSARRRRILAGAVVLGAAVQIAYALSTEQSGRIDGTLGVSNNLAAFFAISFATSAAFALSERQVSLSRSFFFTAALLVSGAALVRTGSTGGLAGAIFGTALLFLIDRAGGKMHHHTRMLLTLAGPVAGFGVTLAFAIRGQELLSALAPTQLARETMRVSMWEGALEIWRAYPLFGAGLGAFEDAFRSPSIARAVAHPHHELFNLAATAGLAGFVVGVAALLFTWSSLLRAATEESSAEERSMALAAFGAVCAITIHGFVDFPLSVPAIGATLACLVGAGLNVTHPSPHPPSPLPSPLPLPLPLPLPKSLPLGDVS